MIDTTKWRAQLRQEEGVRAKPYTDTVGKLTIGVGRNLTDRGLSDDEIEYLLTNDMLEVVEALNKLIPWWSGLDEVRSRVVADMAFNLGPEGLMKWPIFLAQVRGGDYEAAGQNMKKTPWYSEVGSRGVRLVSMMRTGADALPRQEREENVEKSHGNPLHEADVLKQKVDYALVSNLHRALQDPRFHEHVEKHAPAGHVLRGHPVILKGAAKQAVDISQIMALVIQYGPLIAQLIAAFQAMNPPKPAPVPTPAPPPTPTPKPTPPPVPVPPPVSTRKIASGASHIIGVENWNGKPNGHASLGGGTVQNIASGREFCGAGYRIHLDSTPKDAAGVPFYNSDLHNLPKLFCQFPEQVTQDATGKFTCGEGANRVNHYITIDGQEYGPMGDMVGGDAWSGQAVVGLTSEGDDGALTPVILINYDVPLGQEFSVSYRAEMVEEDGSVIAFTPTTAWKVKAWGF